MIWMKFIDNPNKARFVFLLFLVFFISCSEDKDDRILARIGEVEITVDDFLNRSELTLRPPYCRSDSERDKLIILNTLILEKIFATEERPGSSPLADPQFKAYIKGRKEQYMREELFERLAVTGKDLDSVEIVQAFKQAGFIYDVAFCRLDGNQAAEIEKYFRMNPGGKDSLFQTLAVRDTIPRHRLKFDDPEYPSLQHTFYDGQREKGEIVGPVRLRETKYMILKIENILYEPAMSQTEVVLRRKRVKEKLIEKKTNENWNIFTANLMKGKKIQFFPEVTKKVASLWSSRFVQQNNVTQLSGGADKEYGQFIREIDLIAAEPMFRVDKQVWTVADFKNALSSHPLVLRKADLVPSEYVEQFRLAVADLVRDTFITQEAYRQELDKLPDVQRKAAMWEDAYLALEHRDNYLASLHSDNKGQVKTKNYHKLIDPYIKQLINKYKDQIELNTELFKKIKLTHTDLISVQQFVPYEQIVPPFPFLTRTDQLEINTMLN